MDKKEKKGGILTNKDVEEDLKAKNKAEDGNRYIGSQDTGDNTIRQMGNDVQKNDGIGDDDHDENNR
ncbi:MAG TPA: hypothetical protein VM368_01315 [Flavisolibacter sp.]|nr:hypothetical protein [Flavisolibacter sp.]